MSQPTAGMWAFMGASVVGRAHLCASPIRAGQDAVGASPHGGAHREVVLAVADGHGGERYVDSDTGARLAVAAMIELAGQLRVHTIPPPALKEAVLETIPRLLERRWRSHVHEWKARRGDSDDDVTSFGTTVLGALLADEFAALWQLGDGDVILVGADGTVTTPLAQPGPVVGTETTSLCLPDAWTYVRAAWHHFTADRPALVLLSTDGLANSYVDRPAFQAFAVDVLALAQQHGIDWVRSRLPEWLARASYFSGDDVSVVGAFRVEAGGAR